VLEPDLIQIAGIHDEVEARLIINCGVRYLGFPLRLPVHVPDIAEDEAARLIGQLRPGVRAVAITYLERADDILAFCRDLGVSFVQLHGEVERRELESLRARAPHLTVIKSLVVGRDPPGTLESLVSKIAPVVDAFLTDTFDPQTGASGATGRTHDWRISRRLVELSPRPVVLAGGLTPENVRHAIHAVRPHGVDAHTGVEDSRGRKDRVKLEKFVGEARAAFAEIGPRLPRS
jgi:phosphoribosylanthranilate isomerase